MKYKNHIITKTNSTTSEFFPMPFGKMGFYSKVVPLYRVEGKHGKEEGKRPFITSIAAAKEYITDAIDDNKNTPNKRRCNDPLCFACWPETEEEAHRRRFPSLSPHDHPWGS